MIILLICITIINMGLLLYLVFIPFQKKKDEQFNPYEILVKSIQILQYNNSPPRLCCNDERVINLFKQNIVNVIELNYQYEIYTGYYLENLTMELTKCLTPNKDTLCIKFDRFILRGAINEVH